MNVTSVHDNSSCTHIIFGGIILKEQRFHVNQLHSDHLMSKQLFYAWFLICFSPLKISLGHFVLILFKIFIFIYLNQTAMSALKIKWNYILM